MNTILLVEDNPHIMKINHTALMMEGYHILEAGTVAECLAALTSNDVDLIVLDVMLPDGDGVELCTQIKQRYDVPILFLSALGENKDIIAALRAGGDDYLPKPYDIDVLIARIEARLRSAHTAKRTFAFNVLNFDTVARRCFIQGQDLMLSQKEFSLLLLLAQANGQPVPKERLYQSVWGADLSGNSTALHTAISRTNTKLKKYSSPISIAYVRDKGYALKEL